MPLLKLESGLYVNPNQVASFRVDDQGNVGIVVPTPIARPLHGRPGRTGGFEPSALPVYNLSGSAARAVIDYLAGTEVEDLTSPAPPPAPAPPAVPA
jgi:hypothetical protein